jgi:GDP-L-fucose synthase
MPTNLYGPNDNFDLEKSHVLPALIRKIYLGKCLHDKKWDLIRKDLNKRPIESISGESKNQNIVQILEKYGVKVSESFISVEIWGSGKPQREFLYSEDLADACLYILENINFNDIKSLNEVVKTKVGEDSPVKSPLKLESQNNHINIGTGTDISIKDLAEMIKKIIGFKGKFIYNFSKPDGTLKKVMNIDRLEKLGWKYKIELKEGISKLYNWYVS